MHRHLLINGSWEWVSATRKLQFGTGRKLLWIQATVLSWRFGKTKLSVSD